MRGPSTGRRWDFTAFILLFLRYAATINTILTVSIEIQIVPGYGARHIFSAFSVSVFNLN